MFQEWRLFFDMQQTVRLLNDLGERYGSEHEYFDLRSPAEAIKLLCINKPEFAKELAEAHKHGIAYTLVQADEFLDYDDLHLPLGKNDLILTPVVAGSGGGVGKVLLGIGIIAFAVVTAGAGLVPGLGLGFGLSTAVSIGAVGAGLVLSGVSQMLSPQPVIPDLTDRSRPGQNTNATGPQGVSRATSGEQSYAFSGPANTVGIGATVPLVYGELLIGSHLISSDIDITAESDPTGEYFSSPGTSSVTVNGEKPRNEFKSLVGLRTRRWGYSDLKGENNDTRKKFSEDIYFDDTGTTVIASNNEIENKDDEDADNLQIFLEVDKGLYNTIASQKVPAFVTYEMTIFKNNYSGTSPTFANVRGTLSGLLTTSQDYKYCHAISYGATGQEDGDTTIELRFRIIDTDADSSNRIVVRALGYNWFRKESENKTEDLAET